MSWWTVLALFTLVLICAVAVLTCGFTAIEAWRTQRWDWFALVAGLIAFFFITYMGFIKHR